MDEILDYRSLKEEEKAVLLLYLALKRPLPEVKTDFERFFEKKIRGEVIIRFAAKFKEAIKEKAKEELNNIDSEPLAHSKIRLQFIYKGLQAAATPQPVGSFKQSTSIGGEETVIKYDVNHNAIKGYIQLAQNEELMSKKLYLELIKVKQNLGSNNFSSGFKPIEINTGLTWSDPDIEKDEEPEGVKQIESE